MSASNADSGYNTSFGVAADDTYASVTDFAEVASLTPPGYTRNVIDVTHLKSPDEYMEYIGGMRDGGEASMTLNYVPSATDALLAELNQSGRRYYQITFPGGVKMQFAGFCTGWEPGEVSPDDKLTLAATIKATGAPTIVAAA